MKYSLTQLMTYFLKLGATGFGGPVALVGYMHRDLVERNKWISEEDYKEGLALAQLAPGPLAAQLAIYMGYVQYKILGATVVGLAFVLPSFLMVLGLGVAYQYYGGLPWMQAVFYGISAAVIGIIGFSSYKLANKSLGSDKWLWGLFALSFFITVATQSESVWLFLGAGVLYWLVKAPPQYLRVSNAITVFILWKYKKVQEPYIRRKTKNNVPNLVILFPLLCSKFSLNNLLFLKKFILIKENIITNLGTLFFVLRLIIAAAIIGLLLKTFM